MANYNLCARSKTEKDKNPSIIVNNLFTIKKDLILYRVEGSNTLVDKVCIRSKGNNNCVGKRLKELTILWNGIKSIVLKSRG